ncbi:MAG: FecR domain-containing protein [Oceanospirillaceae bacterium]|nr:FecR domain-containing protein [Oceanospirillaceae bacterium]
MNTLLRNALLYLLPIGLLLSLSSTVFAAAIGSIFLSLGENYAVAQDGAQRDLERKDDIYLADTLVTGKNGRLQVRFIDGTRLALKPATEFAVAEFEFNENGEEGSKVAFELLKGGMRTITGKIGQQKGDQYRVDTVVATIGIRGTYYGVEYTPDGLYIETIEGLIFISTEADSFEVAAGEAVLINLDTGEFIYVPFTGQTAQGRVEPGTFSENRNLTGSTGSTGSRDSAEQSESSSYWERWTGVNIQIDSVKQADGSTLITGTAIIDPVSSFVNLANKSGSYTYTFQGDTLNRPIETISGTTTLFDFQTTTDMTVNWGTSSISGLNINLNSVNSGSYSLSGSAGSLDSVLNGQAISISGGGGFSEGTSFSGSADIKFIGSNADAVGLSFEASDSSSTTSVKGAAILK